MCVFFPLNARYCVLMPFSNLLEIGHSPLHIRISAFTFFAFEISNYINTKKTEQTAPKKIMETKIHLSCVFVWFWNKKAPLKQNNAWKKCDVIRLWCKYSLFDCSVSNNMNGNLCVFSKRSEKKLYELFSPAKTDEKNKLLVVSLK